MGQFCFIVTAPSSLILILTTAVRWCPRILPLHFDRIAARRESALILSLIRKMSALRITMDTASKILVPLGIVNSLDSERCSMATIVALAALTFA